MGFWAITHCFFCTSLVLIVTSHLEGLSLPGESVESSELVFKQVWSRCCLCTADNESRDIVRCVDSSGWRSADSHADIPWWGGGGKAVHWTVNQNGLRRNAPKTAEIWPACRTGKHPPGESQPGSFSSTFPGGNVHVYSRLQRMRLPKMHLW